MTVCKLGAKNKRGVYLLSGYPLFAEREGATSSEQYKRDIPLEAANSYGRNRKRTIFTAKQFRQFSEMARELNQANEGDQAAFYLTAKVI